MKIVFRLVTACLLLCLVSPRPVRAGGDVGNDPYEIGEKFFARKDHKTALKYFRKALGKNDVRAHYRMGLIYEDAGKDREALTQYRRFIELAQPDTRRSDSVRRVGDLEERLKRKPARAPGLLEQGKSLFRKGSYRDAERVLLEAAAQNESKPEIHFYLGEVYMELRDYGRAEAEYTKAKGYYR